MENQLKEMLRRDGIRLWLPPYMNNGIESAADLSELINKYTEEKGWSVDSVRECIIRLQSYAVSRMAANKIFQDTGKATVYVNFVKPETMATDPNESQTIEIYLFECGKNLRELAGQKFQLPLDHFKLIAAGRVVDDNKTLQEQGINHLSEILCIKLTEDEINNERQRIWQMTVDQTRNAVNKLANQVQIADQFGNTLDIPDEEKTALSTGMALHEKGKKVLKAKQPGLALLCFLEADKEFSQCRSTLLEAVDNYAILCLDIVWCYLQLQSVNSLPDAEKRLREAENGFRRSYGVNFERLNLLKKGAENEKVLIIRLQILQGILAYYNKHYKRAFSLLLEAESGIKQMDVDEDKLLYLIQMGYSDCEARLALRSMGGNVEKAVQKIIDDREEAEELKVREETKGKDRQLQKELGNTADGKRIDLKKYRDLMSLGYASKIAADALKQASNDFNAALEILYSKQASGDLLNENLQENSQGAASSSNVGETTSENNAAAMESVTKQLTDMGMGFVTEILTDLTNRHRGNPSGAVAELLQMAESVTAQASAAASTFTPANRDQLQNVLTEAVNKFLGTKKEDTKDAEESAAAWATLQEDIPEELDSHLNVTLEEEEQFLLMYKNLVMPHVD